MSLALITSRHGWLVAGRASGRKIRATKLKPRLRHYKVEMRESGTSSHGDSTGFFKK